MSLTFLGRVTVFVVVNGEAPKTFRLSVEPLFKIIILLPALE